MLALDCPTQSYDWGSTYAIPAFQQRDPSDAADGAPIAEVWVGTHPLGTAEYVDEQGERRPLTEVSGPLGIMLKVLAAERPLSIQVHPNAERARIGFDAEEAQGMALNAPDRVFKDPHPKPEMVYALSTFDTLVGLRRTSEIVRILAALDQPVTNALVATLVEDPGFAGIVRLIEGLLVSSPSPEDIAGVVAACRDQLATGRDVKRAFETAVELGEACPGDVGVIISLLLNRLTLQPGEAAYLATGIIHAHLRGLCLEVMVSSDNVLRAGLTTKHIDASGLVACLEEGASRAARVEPRVFQSVTDIFNPTQDFALSVTQSSPADPDGVVLPGTGPRLLMCTSNQVTITNEAGQSLTLTQGDAAFAAQDDGALRVTGVGEIAQAFVPTHEVVPGQLLSLV